MFLYACMLQGDHSIGGILVLYLEFMSALNVQGLISAVITAYKQQMGWRGVQKSLWNAGRGPSPPLLRLTPTELGEGCVLVTALPSLCRPSSARWQQFGAIRRREGEVGAAGRAGGYRAEWVGGNGVAARLAAWGRSHP